MNNGKVDPSTDKDKDEVGASKTAWQRAGNTVSLTNRAGPWKRIWRVLRWFLFAFVLFYTAGLLLSGYHWAQTPGAVERIHARKVTMEMVLGQNVPPEPSVKEKDRTVAGVDANGNGVRDDVELEIHRRHPDSAKIRAAQLQYAMALQSQLTDVFSEKTLVAALQEKGRGTSCIYDTHEIDWGYLKQKDILDYTPADTTESDRLFKKHDQIVKPIAKEVESLVLNTGDRKFAYEQTYDYMTSYGGSEKLNNCDIELEKLPN